MRFSNKTALITGASVGIGRAVTLQLAKEVADKGITVNAVSPGTVSSSVNPDINSFVPHEASYIGRSGTNAENANLICFLASEQSSYISGQNIQIDGCRKII
jgi:NAD(P)-dependent dehydrogenase (short-subunit alcohol dehydrogenase family)